VALFPQLVAGPIVRYSELDEQLRERRHSLEKFGRGTQLFMCGFAKKILVADSAARAADIVFADAAPGAAAAWLGVLGYTLQIYYDFSGYSDMARGLGNMFGFEFPLNFASPYRSRSITEFWRRWHISLSNWLRDYLYIPLGGSRGGALMTARNLALTMLLGGLWHGAQWTFVIWGAFHGLILGLERLRGKKAPWGALPAPLQVALTLVLVMIGWVFFRAPDFQRAFDVLGGMFGAHGWSAGLEPLRALDISTQLLAAAGFVLLWAGMQSDRLVALRGARGVVWTGFCFATFTVAIAHMFFQDYSPFIYFQF
jgi:alginate O-acetyltransferase complex protein AlgI